jgi:Right handed beta helix region
MKTPANVFTIAVVLWAIIFVPVTGPKAQDAREEGPIEIEKCQTISQPGSYKLVKNLTFTGSSGACLMITASGVTLDLAGFTISGHASGFATTTAILASGDLRGIAVQNGSLSGFQTGVNLSSATGSLVEKLRVIDITRTLFPTGIIASGIVRSNSVLGPLGPFPIGTGISATGTLTGNYVAGNGTGMSIGRGSTVIDNTATDNQLFGFFVSCPSNVTDNTALNNPDGNLVLETARGSCNTTNNVAP